jgi:hypothetical protein
MSYSESERISGSANASKPFVANSQYDNQLRDVVEALDRLGRAVSAIDHKLNVLIARIGPDSAAVAVLAASLEGKPKSPPRP